MSSKIKVLFLPRWYPHKHDPMPGLFIQRQAEALTSDCDVAVIYVHPDPNCPNKIEVDFCEEKSVGQTMIRRVTMIRRTLQWMPVGGA